VTLEDLDRPPEDPDAVDDERHRGPGTDDRDRRDPTDDEGSMSFPGEDAPDDVGSAPDEMGQAEEP